MTSADMDKLLEDCISRLMEHCDAVQIGVSWPAGDKSRGTLFIDKGAGNFFARLAQANAWVESQKPGAIADTEDDDGGWEVEAW